MSICVMVLFLIFVIVFYHQFGFDMLYILFFDKYTYMKLNLEYLHYMYMMIFLILYFLLCYYIRSSFQRNQSYMSLVAYRLDIKRTITLIEKIISMNVKPFLCIFIVFLICISICFNQFDILILLYIIRFFMTLYVFHLFIEFNQFVNENHWIHNYCDLIYCLLFIFDLIMGCSFIVCSHSLYYELIMILTIVCICVIYHYYVCHRWKKRGEL